MYCILPNLLYTPCILQKKIKLSVYCQVHNVLPIYCQVYFFLPVYSSVYYAFHAYCHKYYILPVYVHSQSNHPKSILENIPKSVNRRLSKISANEEIFNTAAPPFQEALQKSGYSFKLKFEAPEKKIRKNRNRKRNETYLNPQYSLYAKTNV